MNIDAIIDQLGGASAVQALLGVGPSAVSNYRIRGAFPEYARVKIWQALKARGVQVDPETLELIGAVAEASSPQTTASTAASSTASSAASSGGVTAPSILLIISGGIAAYKALELIRRMKDKGWQVRVIMTKGGAQFVTPLSVSALSGEKTYTDLFSLTDEAEMGHIRLARDADLVVVAPATANIMARMAQGMSDDLATTAVLATGAPILIAPAMNPHMWANPATRANAETLKSRGMRIIGPDSGDTACGEEGAGRLVDPMAILSMAEQMLPGQTPLKNRRIVVTSGPTHEPIDGVRYIANRSSGKQGQAIAEVLARHGAEVTLISGPVDLPPPAGADVIRVTTAKEMLSATLNALPADAVICAAAVADWAVDGAGKAKLKKTPGQPPALTFVENPDILATISGHPQRPKLVVGFAAETETPVAHGDDKRRRKGCDWILANDVGAEAPVFGADDNQVHFITAKGAVTWPRMTKHAVAEHLATEMIKELTHG
ncbi:MAG: bifunctional phosphopantothenoylcysteine decarboxylase/phosphopantothenate--cysteine ligase CoaBC [Alphaproteobacteria bacterium]|nr:bifunctional phosphopantothenoylcysteine decarboxylase/phosphopantothenate--cysteine ligase CoaBC [Alphaproteobacteria bacterium]